MHGLAAEYYDKIYSSKNYQAEAAQIDALIRKHNPSAKSLLDVGCGAGGHLEYLRKTYDVHGLDISEDLVRLARKRLSSTDIFREDMIRFHLRAKFDAIICLFSTIGYAYTKKRLLKAVSNMANHMNKNGVLVIEPWFTKATWKPQPVYATFIDEPSLKIARISNSKTIGNRSIIEMNYLIGTSTGTKSYREHHEMGLFSSDEMIDSFKRAHLECKYEENGITGRGLYIGMKAV
jgi:SAM-dependent methyltransferase